MVHIYLINYLGILCVLEYIYHVIFMNNLFQEYDVTTIDSTVMNIS